MTSSQIIQDSLFVLQQPDALVVRVLRWAPIVPITARFGSGGVVPQLRVLSKTLVQSGKETPKSSPKFSSCPVRHSHCPPS